MKIYSPFILIFLRRIIPKPIIQIVRKFRAVVWNLWYKRGPELTWENDFPWSSPNVWQRIVEFYNNRFEPVIFEYGTGISSLHHIKNVLIRRGKYIGVEHDLNAYTRTIQEVISFCLRHKLCVTFQTKHFGKNNIYNDEWTFVDTIIEAYDKEKELNCQIKLKFRPTSNTSLSINIKNKSTEKYRAYVCALNEPCDIVIIDGKVRKECVNYVLNSNFLKSGGMMALFEAWRGMNGWMGHPALKGIDNYQPEVQRMLSLGGEIVHGIGLDKWPGQRRRRTMDLTAFQYPYEACFLVKKKRIKINQTPH